MISVPCRDIGPSGHDMRRDAKAELDWQRLDRQLDRELEATFPVSDALKITRRPPDIFENRQALEDQKDQSRDHAGTTRDNTSSIPRYIISIATYKMISNPAYAIHR